MRAVLFGYFPGWAPLIATHLDHSVFAPGFAALDRIDLSRFDAVLPLRIDHYPPVREALERQQCQAIIPNEGVAALCDDKLALSAKLIELGFSANIPRLFDEQPHYPCIAKPRTGEFGTGCHILVGPAEVPQGYFLQAFIPGTDEFAVHVFRTGGRIHYFGTVRYVMSGPAMIRSADARPERLEAIDGTVIKPLIARILAALDYEGTCCVNIKFHEGVPMILEVNPRFGASLSYDVTRYATAYCEALGV